MVQRPVVLLGDIVAQIVQHGQPIGQTDQLPIPVTDRSADREAPQHRVVRTAVGLAGQVRQQINAVQLVVRANRAAGRRDERGREIERTDGMIVFPPGPQRLRPAHHEGHSHAAFPEDPFLPVQWRVPRGVLIQRPAVVADEYHQRLFGQLRLLGRVQNLADIHVQAVNHGTVRPPAFVRDVRVASQVLFRSLQGSVGRVERNEQEKRLVPVSPDEVHGLVADIVRDVRDRFCLFVIALDGSVVALSGRGGEVIVPAAGEAPELVEATFQRMELRQRTQMPFADQTADVAQRFQAIRDRSLPYGQAAEFRIESRLVPGQVVVVAEGGLIAPGQQSGPRRTANRSGDVAIRADRAFHRQTVEVRRLDLRAAVKTDVRVAQIIGDHQDEIRFRCRE